MKRFSLLKNERYVLQLCSKFKNEKAHSGSMFLVYKMKNTFLKRFSSLQNKKKFLKRFHTYKMKNKFLKFEALQNENTLLKRFHIYKMKKDVFAEFSSLEN